MDKKTVTLGALSGLILTGAIVGAVSAQSAADATGLSQQQAIEIALKQVPGEVREVELEKEDGAMVYEIEIVSADGQPVEVEIAAETGTIIEVEREDEDHDDDDDDTETDA